MQQESTLQREVIALRVAAEQPPEEKLQETAGRQCTMNSGKKFVFDYRGYDALFPTYLSLSEKCGMACCRLKYPVCLSEETAAEYRVFVAENLTDILCDISKMQDIDRLALLAELNFFTEDNIGSCLDVFARTGATKCTGFLLNYQGERFMENEFDFSL